LLIGGLKLKIMCISICRASRGRYTAPIPIPEVKIIWTDEDGNEGLNPPKKYPCEHPKHWNWGKGTRNGQKLYYPSEEMFYQKWHLTKKEMKEAIRQYDIFSLEMTGRIICRNCAEHELDISAKNNRA
jgi:hypothetical protein